MSISASRVLLRLVASRARGPLGELGGKERATWEEIRNRIIYGSTDWRIIKLRELIDQYKGEASKAIGDARLPDNWLSHRDKTIRADIFAEIDWLWRELSAEFQRALIQSRRGLVQTAGRCDSDPPRDFVIAQTVQCESCSITRNRVVRYGCRA